MILGKKAQIWYVDLILALTIFSLVLVFFYKTDLNITQSDDAKYYDLMMEAKIVTNDIMSPGYPTDWTNTTIRKMGLLDGARVDNTKLAQLMTMSYNQTRSLFRTKYDFYMYFERAGQPVLMNGSDGYGYPGVNRSTIRDLPEAQRILKVSRILIYNGKPTRLEYVLWST